MKSATFIFASINELKLPSKTFPFVLKLLCPPLLTRLSSSSSDMGNGGGKGEWGGAECPQSVQSVQSVVAGLWSTAPLHVDDEKSLVAPGRRTHRANRCLPVDSVHSDDRCKLIHDQRPRERANFTFTLRATKARQAGARERESLNRCSDAQEQPWQSGLTKVVLRTHSP
jgi:hypothetical protein